MEIKDPVTLTADYIRQSKENFLLTFKGEPHWFPKDQVDYNQDSKELIAPRKLLAKKFPGEF